MLQFVGCLARDRDLGLVALACLLCLSATSTGARLHGPGRAGGRWPRPIGTSGAAWASVFLAFAIAVTYFIARGSVAPELIGGRDVRSLAIPESVLATAAGGVCLLILAMRQAKHEDRGRWCDVGLGMHLLPRANRSMEYDLRIALKEDQFSLNYQPFLNAATLEIAGYEALLRWDHPERGCIAPIDFISLAEETGLIVPIGSWVLATACAEAASWGQPFIISVNLSPAQFVQPGIVSMVAGVLHRTGLSPNRLELEITEGTLMDDTQSALRILTSLKALGVRLAMDDFGTGYSSLSYLRKFPFDKIKIDRSFISDVEDDSGAEVILRAIVAMGRGLRLGVTAEGVETKQQLAMLQTYGCDFVQGHLLGCPCSAAQLDLERDRLRLLPPQT